MKIEDIEIKKSMAWLVELKTGDFAYVPCGDKPVILGTHADAIDEARRWNVDFVDLTMRKPEDTPFICHKPARVLV